MSKNNAYVASGEYAFLVCAYSKTVKGAFKALGKKIDEVSDENTMLIGINTYFDDDGYYHLTATLSTTAF